MDNQLSVPLPVDYPDEYPEEFLTMAFDPGLAAEISREIDEEILRDLRRADAPRLLNKLAPVHPRQIFPHGKKPGHI